MIKKNYDENRRVNFKSINVINDKCKRTSLNLPSMIRGKNCRCIISRLETARFREYRSRAEGECEKIRQVGDREVGTEEKKPMARNSKRKVV